eukprot:gene10555-2680_t
MTINSIQSRIIFIFFMLLQIVQVPSLNHSHMSSDATKKTSRKKMVNKNGSSSSLNVDTLQRNLRMNNKRQAQFVRCATQTSQMEQLENEALKFHLHFRRQLGPVPLLVLKVHFHIFHTHAGEGYVDKATLHSQVAIMSAAFRGQTGDNRAADTGIDFVLGSIDYIQDAFLFSNCHLQSITTSIKDLVVKEPATSLNIIVCKPFRNVLGWAVFPGDFLEDSKQNAIFVHVDSLPGGPTIAFSSGVTAVHEAGHYFGLRHTFSNNECHERSGDFVADTPLQKSPSIGCPNQRNSCPHTQGMDPVNNYMDYSNDLCVTHFTLLQAVRMRIFTELHRPKLFSLTSTTSRISYDTTSTAVTSSSPTTSTTTAQTLSTVSTIIRPTASITTTQDTATKSSTSSMPTSSSSANMTHTADSISCSFSSSPGSPQEFYPGSCVFQSREHKANISRLGRSQRTCKELGWPVHGIHCMAAAHDSEGACLRARLADTLTICTDLGARVCSMKQVLHLSYVAVLCEPERNRRFWTDKHCDVGRFFVGVFEEDGGLSFECTRSMRPRGIICCADE